MTGGDVIKWGAIGLGGWWLLHYFNGGSGLSLSSLTGALPPSTPSPATTTPITTTPATTTPATTAAPTVPTIGKYAYTNKSSYLAALINAVADAGGASGLQTADGWNYLMVNTVGVNLAPAPDAIMAALGLDRNATLTASAYYNGMNAAGLLPYPSGLSGLGLGSARVIAVPRVLVARLANGKTVIVRG